MFDLKTLNNAVQQIAEEKNIDPSKVIEAIEDSIAAAYKREYEKKGEIVKAKFDNKSGDVKFWQVKTVVDETTVDMSEPVEGEEEAPTENEEEKLPRYNEDRHILLEEAKKNEKEASVGDEVTFPLESHSDFGRIAAQTAKQVILQKLREAERDSILQEFKDKEGEIISGVVQRFERGNVYIDLGRATGIMFYNESIPGEHYRSGDRIKFYVLAIQEDARTPGIVLSRSHPKFVSRLFAMEVPEIADETVEIKAIAREAGSRTKFAVYSNVEGIDPVGSCVGQRGMRVMAVSNELGQEKLDIIEWSEDPATFIANSLSPAKVQMVEILPKREAQAFVADDQLSLAIGKGGQNVRLAAKITGWKIDVRSQSNPDEVQKSGIGEIKEEEVDEKPAEESVEVKDEKPAEESVEVKKEEEKISEPEKEEETKVEKPSSEEVEDKKEE
jgi:N utilization substance protein A